MKKIVKREYSLKDLLKERVFISGKWRMQSTFSGKGILIGVLWKGKEKRGHIIHRILTDTDDFVELSKLERQDETKTTETGKRRGTR